MSRLREAAAGGPVVFLGFGALMAVHTGVTFAFSHRGTITVLLLAGVAAASLLTGLATLVWRLRDPRDAATPLVLAGVSLATTLLAAGVAGLVLAAFTGPWLVLVAAGAVVFGLGGLARERRARPR